MVGDDGVEAADGGEPGRQRRLGAGPSRVTRPAPEAAIVQRAFEAVHQRIQVGDKRRAHAMREELAAERFDLSREFASRREQPLVRRLSRHLELAVRPGRDISARGQHTHGPGDRLKPGEQRFARSSLPRDERRRRRRHVREVLRVEVPDRRGHRRELLPRQRGRGKQVAMLVAEMTDPNQRFVLTPCDGVHDSLTSLRRILAQERRRSPDRKSEKI
jgi:hypothetical protein